jgi:hypothetical protein
MKLLAIPQEGGQDVMTREEYVGLVEARQAVIRERVIDSLGL